MKTYYLLRLAEVLSRLVPVRLAYWLCSLIGGIVFFVNSHIREAVTDNMRHVLPHASERAQRKVARRVVRNVVKNYYDLVRLPHMDKKDVEYRVTVYGIENFDKALKSGKGAIFFTGHIGNFNLVPQMAATRGYHINIVAEDIEPPKLYDYVNEMRARFGLRLIKAGSSQVRTIYKLLRKGEGLALAADRDVTDSGIPVQFFDALADLPAGPVVLALRIGCPLVPVHCMRLANNGSAVYIYPPMELERTGDRDLDVQVNMHEVAQVLEGMISRAPDQWVVLQKVWDRDYTESIDQTPEAKTRSGEEQKELVASP